MRLYESPTKNHSSFRDPAGFVFEKEGRIYRQINQAGAEDYSCLMGSGLYDDLVKKNWLISHRELSNIDSREFPDAYRIIEPEMIPFVSYPYEWSFSQLKDAALLTLNIQLTAMEKKMSLKDASAYNIQFVEGLPVLIDTLSFEKYREGPAWVALGQFCRHFLVPLCLMKYVDTSLLNLLRANIDGIQPALASKILPLRTWLSPTLFFNIHLRAISPMSSAGWSGNSRATSEIPKKSLVGVLSLLEAYIRDMAWKPSGTVWADYYTGTNYTSQGFDMKLKIVAAYLDTANPTMVCDYGANNGIFSRLAAQRKIFTIAADMDPSAVEKNYRQMKSSGEKYLLPLLIDLANPSPAIGWNHKERDAFLDRLKGGLAMMLALVHHLVITSNIPFEKIVEMVAPIHAWLLIEFVPREDSQVQKLLANRKDIYSAYTQEKFENAFTSAFEIVQCDRIPDSHRLLYLMKNKTGPK